MYTNQDASSSAIKVKVIGQGLGLRSTDARNSRFNCHIIRCELARRGVRRREATAKSSARGFGVAWQCGRSDLEDGFFPVFDLPRIGVRRPKAGLAA